MAINLDTIVSKVTDKISGNSNSKVTGTTISSSNGIDDAKKTTFSQGAPREFLSIDNAPTGRVLQKIDTSVPILLQSEVRALMMQIGYVASNWDTQKTNYTTGDLGRYQVSKKTLVNYGYRFSGNLDFTGKDGIKYDTEFLFDNNVQDRIMEKFIVDQYQALIKNGGIQKNDSKETVAGMIATAYQFQDANPSLSDAMGALNLLNTSDLVGSAGSLSTSLGSSLSFGSGATQSTIDSQLSSSGVLSSAQTVLNQNPTSLLSKTGNSTDKALPAALQKIVDQSQARVESARAALSPQLTQMQAFAKKQAAQVDVSKLKSSATELATSIPANKSKEWRLKGKEKDSQGRPGSLFFNAGRYAIQVLAADVTQQDISEINAGTAI
jgi:hypothetical protein